MIFRSATMLIAVLAVSAASAQPTSAVPPPATDVAQAPIDPATLATAERLVRLFLPEGAMQQLFGGMTSQMESMTTALTDGLAPSDIGAESPTDPHLSERARISSRVMGETMTELMSGLEPMVRQAMSAYYARRFTLAELEEMIGFFSTPTGSKYARLALTMQQDPLYLEMMSAMMPRMMEGFATINERIQAATAHLPPPSPPIEPVEGNAQ